MKGSMLWKLGYVFCALAGLLAGYGIFTLTSSDEVKPNAITKDNTLVRESENSVFFDGIDEVEVMPTQTPAITQPPTLEEPEWAEMDEPKLSTFPTIMVEPEESVISWELQSEELEPVLESKSSQLPEVVGDLPSMASQWANAGLVVVPTPIPVITPPVVTEVPKTVGYEPTKSPAAEVITYPVEIFGQVPVINRTDVYVSYFEFAYDLVTMLEPEVQQRGLNMNVLLAKFVIKALFCGVDIEKLDINAPIPRRLAALCLWLAAQILEEEGCDTTAKSAQKYVTDISGCSSAEKKAVAYLYEQGIMMGYQTAGQQFYPDAGLKTESGRTWLSRVKQCWN